jgi:alpha-ketoglutarate-dependent taurine dioxygenase
MNSEYKTLKVIPVSREIGAEISGVDIASGVDDEQFAELKQAYRDYAVIFIRDQDITPDQHIEFAKRWSQRLKITASRLSNIRRLISPRAYAHLAGGKGY